MDNRFWAGNLSSVIVLTVLLILSSCISETETYIPTFETTVTLPVTVTATATFTTTVTVTVASADPLDLSYLIDQEPGQIDNSTLPVTPLERMHIIGSPRPVDIGSYRFSVTGLVNNPLSLSYEELKAYPEEDRVVLLICPYIFADNPRWTGVPLTYLLAAAGVQAGAKEIVLQCDDGFELPQPLEKAPDILLAYEVDGETLPPGHGYPVRAVVKGVSGAYWIRWMSGIAIR
jgi:DMSO/TMAO reductase YedYZ molybdopterin-dependent catalytic subunit